ncbi:MAG: hypothetical protein ABSF83_07580 [Nitrososphaerales archaeon]
MRSAYEKVSGLLGTTKGSNLSESRVVERFNRQFLKVSGWTDEEMNSPGIDLGSIPEENLQELIAQKDNEKLGANAIDQKVVPKSEVKDWLSRGYEFVTRLDDAEAIVRRPR